MSVEYLVLQAYAEQGAFARVSAQKLNRSWETLQAALDELGRQEDRQPARRAECTQEPHEIGAGEPASRDDRRLEHVEVRRAGDQHFDALRLERTPAARRLGGVLADGAAGDGDRVLVQQPGLEQRRRYPPATGTGRLRNAGRRGET